MAGLQDRDRSAQFGARLATRLRSAAAALTGLPLGLAVCYLDALHGGRLLEEPAARRFRMHDLIRRYARGLAEAEDSGLRKRAVDQAASTTTSSPRGPQVPTWLATPCRAVRSPVGR